MEKRDVEKEKVATKNLKGFAGEFIFPQILYMLTYQLCLSFYPLKFPGPI